MKDEAPYLPSGSGPDTSGLAYFLPRQLVRVTATRTGGKLSDAVTKLVKAHSELEAAEAKVAADEATVRATEDQIIGPPQPSDAAKAILDARLAAQKAEVETSKKAVADKTKARDTAKEELLQASKAAPAPEQVSNGQSPSTETPPKPAGEVPAKPAAGPNSGPGAYKVALKLELLAPSADPSQAYRLSPRHTIFRDDEHKLAISQSGLLTSSNIVATDRTGDMLVEIAAFAGAIRGGISGRSGVEEAAQKDCAAAPSDYAGVVDFANAKSIADLNRDLQCLGVRLVAEGQVWPGSTRPAPGGPSTYYKAIEGIVYRSPVEVQVRIVKCVNPNGACDATGKDWHTTEVVALSLPQAGPISYLRQDSGLLTKTKYDLAFKDGIPVDYAGSRPSEILELGRLPMRIVNSAFDGVSKVISLRTGQNNERAALATSQLALLNSQIALQAGAITGQKTISDQQLAALQSQYALQVGELQGKTSLSTAQVALLQQQYAALAAPINGEHTLTTAQLALVQQQLALQLAVQNGGTNLTNAELSQLQAQTSLALARNTGVSQVSASDLALTVSLMRDQNRRNSLNRCVAEKLAASEGIEPCLAAL